MAVTETETTTPPVEFVLDDADLKLLTSAPEPETEPEPEPEPEKPKAPAPAAAAPVADAPKAEPKTTENKGDLGKALKEARGQLKKAKDELVTSKRDYLALVEAERAKAANQIRTAQQPQDPNVSAAKIETLKANLGDLEERLKEEEAAGRPISVTLVKAITRETERLAHATAQEAHRLAQEAITAGSKAQREERAKEQVNDFAELVGDQLGVDYWGTLKASGVQDAVQMNSQGAFNDPVVAGLVSASANPARRAFNLAVQILKKQGKGPVMLQGFEDTESPAESATQKSEAPSTPAAPVTPAPDVVAAAKREAVNGVVEQVQGHNQKPRGVRAVANAGEPQRVSGDVATWRRLNHMMDRDPAAFERLMTNNPDLDRWFMSNPFGERA